MCVELPGTIANLWGKEKVNARPLALHPDHTMVGLPYSYTLGGCMACGIPVVQSANGNGNGNGIPFPFVSIKSNFHAFINCQ